MVAWMWLIAAGVLIGVEILTADLLFASLAISALAAAGASALGADGIGQAIAFAVTATITIGMLRPIALRHLRKPAQDSATGIDALIGAEALTMSVINEEGGQIKLSGEVWTAQTEFGEIPAHTKVRVLRISGATAIIENKE